MQRVGYLGIWGLLAISACAGSTPVAPATPALSADSTTPTTDAVDAQVLASNVTQLVRPATSFGAAVHGGKLYTYGGHFGTAHEYSSEAQSGDLTHIDLGTHRATVVSTGPGVQGAQIVSSPSGLLRVGGMSAENKPGENERIVSLSNVARFDAESGAWENLPALPEARSSHAAVFLDGQLYVLGGWTLTGSRDTGKFATDVLVLDVATGKYRKIAQRGAIRAAEAGILGSRIALVGGLDAKGEPLRTVNLLDPKTGKWSRGPEFPEDASGVAVTSNGRSIFASARDGILYELKDGASAWRAVAYLAFPRFFHQLTMRDEHSVVALGGIGGAQNETRIAHIEEIDVEKRAPRTLIFKLPNPGPAKNRQGAQIIGDELLLFGGNRSLDSRGVSKDDIRSEAFSVDLATMQIRAVANFPAGRQAVETTVVDRTLLALGGLSHDGTKARAQSDAFTYDPGGKGWAPSPSELPSPRAQFGLVAKGDELWVFGGVDYDPSRDDKELFLHPSSVLKASRGQRFAIAPVSLPHPRRAFGGALLDGKYYLIGGMAEGLTAVTACDVYDFASSTWSSAACPATQRISPQLVPLDGKLYLAGGATLRSGQDLTPNATLEVYDPVSNKWSTLMDTIPVEPGHLTMQPYHHALLLYSAYRKDGAVEIAVIVPPPPTSSVPPAVLPSVPPPPASSVPLPSASMTQAEE